MSAPSGTNGRDKRPPAYRVTIVTNGNFFSHLGLRELLGSSGDDLVLQVFVTTGLRKTSGNRGKEALQLLQRWGVRYALYKISTYVLPAVGQKVRRRPLFVRTACETLGIECHVTRNVNMAPAKELITEFAPDLLLSYSCPYKIGGELLALPRVGALNVHSSLLPAYAGICTYVHVLADGEVRTGVTVHEMVSRFDAGKILAQEPIPIEGPMSVFELFAAQCRIAGHLVAGVVKECLVSGRIDGSPQNFTQRSYRGEPTKGDISRLRARGHRLLRFGDLPDLLFGPPAVTASNTRSASEISDA